MLSRRGKERKESGVCEPKICCPRRSSPERGVVTRAREGKKKKNPPVRQADRHPPGYFENDRGEEGGKKKVALTRSGFAVVGKKGKKKGPAHRTTAVLLRCRI